MKHILREHGEILHQTGGRGFFPVRGAEPSDIGFAAHGQLEGRTPIGWNQFFPVFDRRHLAVVVDDEAGTVAIVGRDEAIRLKAETPPPAPQP
jgi:hypothetical protein